MQGFQYHSESLCLPTAWKPTRTRVFFGGIGRCGERDSLRLRLNVGRLKRAPVRGLLRLGERDVELLQFGQRGRVQRSL